MFRKIKERLNKNIDKKIEYYASKNAVEFSRITNRPLEGEIVKIENIKIRKDFQKPKSQKLKQRRKYYERYNYFRSTIVLSQDNYLLDGYTTYLLAKKMNFDFITIVRAR